MGITRRTGAEAAAELVLGPDLTFADLILGLCAGQGRPRRVPLLQQKVNLLHALQAYPQKTMKPAFLQRNADCWCAIELLPFLSLCSWA
jgi:hypothetical protein